MNNEKVCENCKYYFQHYFMWKSKYRKAGCGHCTKSGGAHKKSRPSGCELWEDIALQKEERKESVEDALTNMSKRLSEISMILKEDAE